MANKVLIIEDQHPFMLQELLELYGDFEFEIAADGYTAMEKLAGELPDLVLLDLRLPGIDGLTILDRIQELDACLPVIVVSAYGDKRTRQEATRRGANSFFQKPVDPARLYRHMRKLMALYRSPSQEYPVEERPVILAKLRRLAKLKERKALLGSVNAPPELLIEIEDLEREIAAGSKIG